MSEKPGLDVLHKAYLESLEAYTAADRRFSIASSDRTQALNNLNRSQNAFEAAFDEMRASAPRDSDWKRGNGRNVHSDLRVEKVRAIRQ